MVYNISMKNKEKTEEKFPIIDNGDTYFTVRRIHKNYSKSILIRGDVYEIKKNDGKFTKVFLKVRLGFNKQQDKYYIYFPAFKKPGTNIYVQTIRMIETDPMYKIVMKTLIAAYEKMLVIKENRISFEEIGEDII